MFKKVSEGIDSFNESYERHELSNSQTQRDKLENVSVPIYDSRLGILT